MTQPPVTAEQLAQAFERLVQRLAVTHPSHYPPATLAEVRANWPLARLAASHAQVWFTGEWLTLQSLSAYHALTDTAAFHVDLRIDSGEAALGNALLQVWEHSPTLTLADIDGPLEAPTLQDMKMRHDQWLKQLAVRHGMKSPRKLLTQLLHCRASRLSDRVELEATDHDRLDGWTGLPGGSTVIPRDCDARCLGSALKNTMTACLDSYGDKKQAGR
jgi:hypothetical protein